MRIYRKPIMADLLTPVAAYHRVARGAERAFLLESVESGGRIGRYSFIGVDPDRSFRGSLKEFRRDFPDDRHQDPDLPPFAGGAVGFFRYDMARELERLPDRGKPAAVPDGASVAMDFFSTIVAFDHGRQQVLILSDEGRDRVEALEEQLFRPQGGPEAVMGAAVDPSASVPDASNFPGFEGAVDQARGLIRAGDIFQVVLSQRYDLDFDGDPFNVYRALRFINPSPYMFFLKQGDVTVAGSSPEMLVRVRGDELEYRPIAGTRRRGRSEAEEKEFERELLSDEKERAEHLMLVDLGRNDLGKVSSYGSVEVSRFMTLEKYSHVMHLVSSIRGRLRPDLNRFDALEACFPAGTVSGAPKVRAMEIIEDLEPDRRGLYAGAVGYLDHSGNLDTCIAIRTILFHGGRAYVQAGAGIVADSIPERENQECRSKAAALVRALEMAEGLKAP